MSLDGSLMVDGAADKYRTIDSPSGDVEGTGRGSDSAFTTVHQTS